MYRLYILKCSDNSLYTGITKDIERRLNEHRTSKKGSKYVKSRLPFELVYECVAGDSRSKAQKMERTLKSLSHEDKEELCKFYSFLITKSYNQKTYEMIYGKNSV